jgi:hypothetical protein
VSEAAGREIGKQFGESSLRAMLVHMYGADWFWLATWRGSPPAVVRGDPTYGLVIRDLAELRRKWDELEGEQRTFCAGLAEAGCGGRSTARPPRAGRTAGRSACCCSMSRPTRPTIGVSSPRCSR